MYGMYEYEYGIRGTGSDMYNSYGATVRESSLIALSLPKYGAVLLCPVHNPVLVYCFSLYINMFICLSVLVYYIYTNIYNTVCPVRVLLYCMYRIIRTVYTGIVPYNLLHIFIIY